MLIYVGLSIALMVLDDKTLFLSRVRDTVSIPLSSLQYLVSWPVRLFDDWGSAISTHDHLVSENRALVAEQLLLRAEVGRLDSIESENQQLRALLHSTAEIRGKVLVARLLAIGSDSFTHLVTLNRGIHDGIFVGQPVMDAYGVMGEVIRVNPVTSQVLLVNDPHSGVPIEVVRSGIRAIATGDLYTRKLHLLNVPQTADIRVGDLLVSSGMGDNYPHGYPVGQVTMVNRVAGLPFLTIEVEPSAHLDRSWQVLLVWPDHEAGKAS